ncbi:MAG: MnmC family methyltransferase, partial [Bacteriovoracia bacterium]
LTRELAGRFPGCFLSYTALEIDEALVRWVLPRAERVDRDGLVTYSESSPTHHLSVLVGDARQTLQHFNPDHRFHVIYQDAFSPKRSPSLWTKEWFALLGSRSHTHAKLSTYSASIAVRKALHAVGWGISAGTGFGAKRTSTRASWQSPSDQAILEELKKHPVGPLSDLT